MSNAYFSAKKDIYTLPKDNLWSNFNAVKGLKEWLSYLTTDQVYKQAYGNDNLGMQYIFWIFWKRLF